MVGMLTIAGYPSSGKSTRAKELASFFEAKIAASDVPAVKRLKVAIINDESLNLSKSAYDGMAFPTLQEDVIKEGDKVLKNAPSARIDSRAEKPARATLFSAVTRTLSKDTIVIVDAMNYIKGSRYQMYCNARESGCRTCTVFVATPPQKCIEWNQLKPEAERYAEATLENLISRFEEPSSTARWDKPLFTVSCFDSPMISVGEGALENADAERIWLAITAGDIKPPNVATLAVCHIFCGVIGLCLTRLLSHAGCHLYCLVSYPLGADHDNPHYDSSFDPSAFPTFWSNTSPTPDHTSRSRYRHPEQDYFDANVPASQAAIYKIESACPE
ncbi:protein KTI12, partial [Phenoliferia sp. Uapishka_3]